MNTTFEIEFRSDHLHVLLGPDYDVTSEQDQEFWAAVEHACREHSTHRVLLEGHVPKTELHPALIVDSGVRAATAVPHLWFAICFQDYEPSELFELYKSVAASRGIHVRFFTDSKRALNWLRTNSPA